MVSNVELTCSLCENIQSVKFTFSDYLKHLRLFHVHQANFRITCGIGGCQRSYTNIRTFQNHVYNVHYCKNDVTSDLTILSEVESPLENNTSDVEKVNDFNCDENSENAFAVDNTEPTVDLLQHSLQNSTALFLLDLKEKYKLTQIAIQGVIEGVSSLTQHQLSLLKTQVFETRRLVQVCLQLSFNPKIIHEWFLESEHMPNSQFVLSTIHGWS